MDRVSKCSRFIGPIVCAVALVALAPMALGDATGPMPPPPPTPENIGPPSPIQSAGSVWSGVLHGVWALAAILAVWRRGWLRLAPRGVAKVSPTSTVPGAGVVLLAGGIVIYCAQIVGAMSAQALLGRGDGAAGISPGAQGVWRDVGVMSGGYVGALATVVFVVLMIPGIDRLAGVPTRGQRWRGIGRGVVRGIAGFAVVYPVAWAFGWGMAWMVRWLGGPVDPLAHKTLHDLAERPMDAGWWMLTALVVIGAPIVEETIYRGFIQQGIASITEKPWIAILGTSFVFALMHAEAVPWHALPVLFLLGIGFGIARHRTGSVVPSIVMHTAFNAVNVAMLGAGM